LTLADMKKDAMLLDKQDREALTLFLVSNLEPEQESFASVNEQWYREADLRYQAFKKGEIAATEASEVHDRLRQRFQ